LIVTTGFRAPSGLPRMAVLTDWVVLVAAAVVPLAVAALAQDSAHVSQKTIMNQTSYQLEVLASTPSDSTLSLVTIIAAGESHEALDFVDRGDTWILHFRGNGFEARPVEVSRADFIDLGRPYSIPDAVAQELDELTQAGVP